MATEEAMKILEEVNAAIVAIPDHIMDWFLMNEEKMREQLEREYGPRED